MCRARGTAGGRNRASGASRPAGAALPAFLSSVFPTRKRADPFSESFGCIWICVCARVCACVRACVQAGACVRVTVARCSGVRKHSWVVHLRVSVVIFVLKGVRARIFL